MVLFSTRLKELRKEVGLTQKQLGEMVGVTKVSICCYENGTRTPTLDTLIDLANSLGVDLAYLLGVDCPDAQSFKYAYNYKFLLSVYICLGDIGSIYRI